MVNAKAKTLTITSCATTLVIDCSFLICSCRVPFVFLAGNRVLRSYNLWLSGRQLYACKGCCYGGLKGRLKTFDACSDGGRGAERENTTFLFAIPAQVQCK